MTWYFAKKEQYAIAVLLVAILGALLVLSYAYGKRGRATAQGPLFTPGGSAGTPAVAANQPAEQLVVHVSGAVNKPGVYAFAPGTRITNAIQQAGGARSDGYPDALNLAERLRDGEKLYIPTKAEWEKSRASESLPPLVQPDEGQSAHASATTSGASSSAAAAGGASGSRQQRGPKALPKGQISLNTATRDQLMTLPGVGPVTAQHILDYRTQHGKFTDLSQLLDVPKIGPKTLEKLTPFLTL